ncbi:MAG: hypothetical protein AAF847_15135 [Bacteroidota bacterium]
MAFSKFKSLIRFCQKYGLAQNTTTHLFKDVVLPDFDISTRLLNDLEESKDYPLYTEKAKSELIISPVLKELKRKNPFISLFSGFALAVEKEPELNGNPDFVLSAKPNLVEIEAPVFCIVESKNKSPEEGFGQCAAEMYASRLFNEEMNEHYETIYGAVTNGFDWIFLKLEGNTIFVDVERYYLNELPKLLGVMQKIVTTATSTTK